MLYKNINSQQSAEPQTIPSPVGGLNGRDSLANMNELDAYELTNLFPGTSTVKVRPGVDMHQDPVGAPVSTLAVYGGATGNHMLAFTIPNIFDVTIPGTVSSLKADLNNDDVVFTMFSTTADSAQFLIMTTGDDVPMSYNGLAITDLAFTGNIDPVSNINFVCNYKLRLFFGTRDRCGFYYLPPGQIQGALEWFDLGQLTLGGGFVQAIATYSTDAGNGPDDYIVFITNRGECIVFTGMDPGDATAWEIVGRFRVAEPIGRKCVLNYAGDLLILTNEGVEQFSKVRQSDESQNDKVALSSKLGSLLLDHNVYRGVYGWCMALWPAGGMLLVNVPHTGNRAQAYHQFVMNTITEAWGEFDGDEWNPQCFIMMNKEMYFGRYDGSIRVIRGQYDIAAPIKFKAKQAYNYFKTPQHKHFKWAQFLVKSEAPVNLSSRLSVDYVESLPLATSSPIGAGAGAEWDIAYWDIDSWGYGPYTQRWIAPYGNYGVAASHWLEGQVAGAGFEWFATEHVFEKASGLL